MSHILYLMIKAHVPVHAPGGFQYSYEKVQIPVSCWHLIRIRTALFMTRNYVYFNKANICLARHNSGLRVRTLWSYLFSLEIHLSCAKRQHQLSNSSVTWCVSQWANKGKYLLVNVFVNPVAHAAPHTNKFWIVPSGAFWEFDGVECLKCVFNTVEQCPSMT